MAQAARWRGRSGGGRAGADRVPGAEPPGPPPLRPQQLAALREQLRTLLEPVVAAEGLEPPTDPIATGWYRREVAGVHLRRLLERMERG